MPYTLSHCLIQIVLCSVFNLMTSPYTCNIGNLGFLDLRGNNLGKLNNDASMLIDLQRDGRLSILFESSPTLDIPYDDDP